MLTCEKPIEKVRPWGWSSNHCPRHLVAYWSIDIFLVFHHSFYHLFFFVFLCYLVYSLPTSPVSIEEEKLGIILLEKSSLAPLHSGWNFLKQSNKESIIYIINCADWLRGGHLRLQNKMLRWKIWDQQSLCLRQTSLRDAVATTCTNHVTPARKKYWLPDCKKYWLWNVL